MKAEDILKLKYFLLEQYGPRQRAVAVGPKEALQLMNDDPAYLVDRSFKRVYVIDADEADAKRGEVCAALTQMRRAANALFVELPAKVATDVFAIFSVLEVAVVDALGMEENKEQQP